MNPMRKLSFFILMAAAPTAALTIGATTTLAVSNTHTPQFQLMGNNDSSPSTSNEFGDFKSAQYGWSHPHHHNHNSLTGMIAIFNGDNSNSTAGSDDRGDFNSAQYGSSDSHSQHHKDSTPNSSWKLVW